MKNSNDMIGNRTRDLPAGSAVPQPTAPQGATNQQIPRRILLTYHTAYHNYHKSKPTLICQTYFSVSVCYQQQIPRFYFGVTRKVSHFHHTLILFLHPHAPSIQPNNQSDSSFSSPVYPQMFQETIPFFVLKLSSHLFKLLKLLLSVASAISFPVLQAVLFRLQERPHSCNHTISL